MSWRVIPFYLGMALLISCNGAVSDADEENNPVSASKELLDLPDSIKNLFLSFQMKNPAEVRQIRQWVHAIDADIYDSITLSSEEFLEEDPVGGGELKGYFKAGFLVKIHEWVGLSNGIIENRYYFNGDSLIFINGSECYFSQDSLGETDYTNIESRYEGDYYFCNRQLIDLATRGRSRAKTPGEEKLITDAKKFQYHLESYWRKKLFAENIH